MALGAILLAAFLGAFALRKLLEHSFVLSISESSQPKRQFFLDFSLSLTIGFAVMIFNMAVFKFPIESGLKVVLGCGVAGFFLSLDSSLARERTVIHRALAADMVLPPPTRLYPMTRKFSLVASTAALSVSAIIGLVISGDVAWLVKIGQRPMAVTQEQQAVIFEVFFVMAVLLIWVVNLIIILFPELETPL